MQQYVCNSVIQGTLYLKQAYQKNMLIALLLGISLHLAALGAYTVVTQSTTPPTVMDNGPKFGPVRVKLLPPPDRFKIPKRDFSFGPRELPEFFIPEPVEDSLILDLPLLPTNNEKFFATLASDIGGSTSSGGGLSNSSVMLVHLPEIDSFQHVEEDPEAIHLASPRYPEMARKAGLRASLIVRALIDVNGDVIDARVMSITTEGVGFEEAALEAAYKCKWTPALQSNQPVACWVSYTVVFELH